MTQNQSRECGTAYFKKHCLRRSLKVRPFRARTGFDSLQKIIPCKRYGGENIVKRRRKATFDAMPALEDRVDIKSEIMKRKYLRYFGLCGVAGPALFTLTTIVCSSIRPDYNHISDLISELGATGTSNAQLMNFAGFIPAGVMAVCFGLTLFFILPKRLLTRIGAALLAMFGLGIIIQGLFSCDPGCPIKGSMEHTIHDQVAGPTFLCAILGALLLGISFRKFSEWRRLWIFSVLSAVISLCFLVGVIITFETRTITGLWQRLLVLTLFVWMVIFGLRILKPHTDDAASNG